MAKLPKYSKSDPLTQKLIPNQFILIICKQKKVFMSEPLKAKFQLRMISLQLSFKSPHQHGLDWMCWQAVESNDAIKELKLTSQTLLIWTQTDGKSISSV